MDEAVSVLLVTICLCSGLCPAALWLLSSSSSSGRTRLTRERGSGSGKIAAAGVFIFRVGGHFGLGLVFHRFGKLCVRVFMVQCSLALALLDGRVVCFNQLYSAAAADARDYA